MLDTERKYRALAAEAPAPKKTRSSARRAALDAALT
jgi:hypothetical protein